MVPDVGGKHLNCSFITFLLSEYNQPSNLYFPLPTRVVFVFRVKIAESREPVRSLDGIVSNLPPQARGLFSVSSGDVSTAMPRRRCPVRLLASCLSESPSSRLEA